MYFIWHTAKGKVTFTRYSEYYFKLIGDDKAKFPQFNVSINATNPIAAGLYKCSFILAEINANSIDSDQWAAKYDYKSPSTPILPKVEVTKNVKQVDKSDDAMIECTVNITPENHIYEFKIDYIIGNIVFGAYKINRTLNNNIHHSKKLTLCF